MQEIAGVDVNGLGYVREAERKALAYNAADVFAFPTKADNQPLVIMEALACGLPVVSSHLGGVPEMIQQGETGWLAEPGDAVKFAEGLRSALELTDDAVRPLPTVGGPADHLCRQHQSQYRQSQKRP